jgi:hypothetical protein
VIALPAIAVALVLGRCHETSDSLAVGFAHCHRFGQWAADDGPRFEFALTTGFGWTRLVPDAKATNLWLAAGKSGTEINSFGAGALGGARMDMATFDVRLDLFRWGPLRGGISYQHGVLPVGTTPAASPVGTLMLHAPTASTCGLPTGIDLRWRRVSFTGDITPAVTFFSADVTDDVSLQRYARFALFVGGGLRVWITPAVALEAGASVDVLSLDHVWAGLKLHLPVIAAFDGVDSV